jgi:hypothetical protein
MAKPDYMEVQETITALVNAYRKADDGYELIPGYEYAAATGNLSAILCMLIAGDLSRSAAFEHLQNTVKRVTAEAK